MNIAVVLRLTPDLAEELELNDDETDIDREWIGLKLNEFDDHALEEAVLLKEATGASVTALAVADEGVDRMLQSAIARGADRAVKIERDDEDHLDSRAAVKILAQAVQDVGANLVITGVQTSEDVFGQLAPYLGAALGWSQVSAASGIAPAENAVEVRQEYSGGRAARIHVTLPAVIGLQTASHPPRYVSGSKLRQAMGSDAMTAAEAGADVMANGAAVAAMRAPEAAGGAEMLGDDADAVAEKLHQVLQDRGIL